MNLLLIFLTGLTTGGLTCLAVQGGLLASVITNQTKRDGEAVEPPGKPQNHIGKNLQWQPVMAFLVAKLIAYTVLGFFLGLLGSAIALSLEMRLLFQLAAALFMLATALNLFNVHPIFRLVVLQPPKFVQRMVHSTTKTKSLFAPAFLGFMTILIPCGVTQAMELVAINSGEPILGAAILFSFVLGTSPLFAFLGIAATKMSALWNRNFLRFTAVVLLFMAALSINGVLIVLDAPLTGQKIWQNITSFGEPPAWYGTNEVSMVQVINGVQPVIIAVSNAGYSPKKFTVKAGIPVTLTLNTDKTYSCSSSFTFKKFNIFLQLEPTGSQTVTFTPTEKGTFTFACSMGMYQGEMEVI